MKPLTCADVEPTLIEYFTSADDPDLVESNLEVPRLVLDHFAECGSCAEQYQGFSKSLQQPVLSKLPSSSVQPIDELAHFVDSQLAAYTKLIDCKGEHTEAPKTNANYNWRRSPSSGLPAWMSWINSLTARPQIGFAAAGVIVAVLALVLWQPMPQFGQSSVAFQTKLDITPKSVEYVFGMKQRGAPTAMMGFSSSRGQFNPFLIGNWYAESIALFLQQDVESSSEHLEKFAGYLQNYPEMKISHDYIVKVQLFLNQEIQAKSNSSNLENNGVVSSSKPLHKDLKNRVLSLFTAFPSIVKYDLEQISPNHSVLFDFGAWVINLNLAALTHYSDIAKERSNVIYFSEHSKSLGLPSGVMKSLDGIGELLALEQLGDEDYKQVFLKSSNLINQLGLSL